ncbi:MAG: Mut7-C RNAse domain-containing protein [Candidatus Tritonobacter lacicola]|nr:Mut7-C RNAse domain-containing protein [Candidatus Tritonobacter lacicola]
MPALGYDTSYDVSMAETEFVKRAVRESRLILTRDTLLGERWTVPSCLSLESDSTFDQLRQVIYRLNLRISDDKIFTICLKCNEPLEEAVREKVEGRVPPYVYRTKDRIFKCPRCGHLYWRGTHHDLVMGIISKVLELKGDREDHIS